MSDHLSNLVKNRSGTALLQIVFCDVEKYSKRTTRTQIEVINALTQVLRQTLRELSRQYQKYAEDNRISFENDVIVIPTGDGVAVVFTFDGLIDLHLSYARKLLANTLSMRGNCASFDQQGWCECHSYFNLRIGISEGKGIIYEDYNGRFNVAGGTVNLASRIMDSAAPNEIVVSEAVVTNIADMIGDSDTLEKFSSRQEVVVKGDQVVSVYRFREETKSEREMLHFIDYHVVGELKLNGNVTLGDNARVDGKMVVDGTVTIEEGAILRADLYAGQVVIFGTVRSDITCGGVCVLKQSARLYGDLSCSRIFIDEGATFVGRSIVSRLKDK